MCSTALLAEKKLNELWEWLYEKHSWNHTFGYDSHLLCLTRSEKSRWKEISKYVLPDRPGIFMMTFFFNLVFNRLSVRFLKENKQQKQTALLPNNI